MIFFAMYFEKAISLHKGMSMKMRYRYIYYFFKLSTMSTCPLTIDDNVSKHFEEKLAICSSQKFGIGKGIKMININIDLRTNCLLCQINVLSF